MGQMVQHVLQFHSGAKHDTHSKVCLPHNLVALGAGTVAAGSFVLLKVADTQALNCRIKRVTSDIVHYHILA